MAHVGRGWGFTGSARSPRTGPGQRIVETYRCKPFGLAEPKRWISREKGRDLSVVVVGSTRLTA
jgi:hypothetical protein